MHQLKAFSGEGLFVKFEKGVGSLEISGSGSKTPREGAGWNKSKVKKTEESGETVKIRLKLSVERYAKIPGVMGI